MLMFKSANQLKILILLLSTPFLWCYATVLFYVMSYYSFILFSVCSKKLLKKMLNAESLLRLCAYCHCLEKKV